ncbi:2'-5' RNA ligase family protein [Streptomyces sp. NPDC001255]|uniref:2'-5' RNA ligase family protein n=1 Tax=Streptomyces sp. NPDC001255 TaxID=3364550 RepID=UPI0036AD89C3
MKDFFAHAAARHHPWPAGRRDLHWLVLPDPDCARRSLYEPYRELVHQPGLHPVLPEWMHATVRHMGPQNSAHPNDVDRLVAEVTRRVRHVAPFTLTMSRPDIGTMALESKAHPGAPFRRLWTLTGQAQLRVVGNRWPLLPAHSYPHITHAYAGPEAHLADRTALKELLSDLDGGPVPVPVTALTLVSEWHTNHQIRWEILAEVPLASRTPAPAPTGTGRACNR